MKQGRSTSRRWPSCASPARSSIHIDRTFALDEVPAALAHVGEGRALGKVVVVALTGRPKSRRQGSGGTQEQLTVMFAALLRQARPPSPLAGRLAVQSLLFALGEGTFMTGSAVFFTQIVGLSAAQVGLGLTLAGIAAFLAALPMGKLVDRFGPKKMWAVSAAGQAAMFAVWPFITDFQGYVAMAVGMEVIGALGGAAHGAYTIDVLPPGRAGEVARRTCTPRSTSASPSARCSAASRWPSTPTTCSTRCPGSPPRSSWSTPPRSPGCRGPRTTTAPPEERKVKVPGPGPLRNPGWLLTTFFGGVFWTNQVLLNIVIPLWLVEETDAPRVLLAFLFGTNTVMCIFLPMVAARGVNDVPTALRAVRVSSTFFVVSCLITLATHDTVGWVTIALVWLGHVTVTGAELYLSAASWSFEAELMDPRQRGAYQGAAELSGTLGRVWAPALYTFLAMNWGAARLAGHRRHHRGGHRSRCTRRPGWPGGSSSSTSPPTCWPTPAPPAPSRRTASRSGRRR